MQTQNEMKFADVAVIVRNVLEREYFGYGKRAQVVELAELIVFELRRICASKC